MKKAMVLVLLMLLCVLIYIERNEIIISIYKIAYKDSLKYVGNDFENNYEFSYLQKTDDFTPKNKKELINVLYTLIDSETYEFVIFCENEYKNCVDDANDILLDNVTLPAINTYVHPYNSYKEISIGKTDYNIIIVNINKQYTEDEIIYTEEKLNIIENEIIKPSMSNKEKILAMHDYIINYTKYVNSNEFAKASSLLLYRKARCSAYTDLMAIYLSRLGIPNYRIASETHIWNYVYLDNKWSHIDLTWDDPILNNNKQVLLHDFFLIDTNKLVELNNDKHIFNRDVYIEAKEN